MQEEEYSRYVGFKVLSILITILKGTEWVNGLDIKGQKKKLEALKSHSANKLGKKKSYTTRSE